MTRSADDPQGHFEAVEALLSRWLEERNTLLSRYTELVDLLEGGPESERLRHCQSALCEILVDYTSAGHFEVFHQLIEEAEAFADGSGQLASRVMPAIGDTTEVILAYDEKYGTDGDRQAGLKRDLSALGEMLESRFMLEDRLIAGLHHRHRGAVTSP